MELYLGGTKASTKIFLRANCKTLQEIIQILRESKMFNHSTNDEFKLFLPSYSK